MKHVIIGGLVHETHTFLKGSTGLQQFRILRGDEILTKVGDSSTLAGALEVGLEKGWNFIPTIHLGATPSGIVKAEVFDLFWEQLSSAVVQQLRLGQLDGIYLDLHGAMVCEGIDDPEGEIWQRLRDIPGMQDIPLCGVLDLHGNITDKVTLTNCFITYRENPHRDAKLAASDGARILDRLMTESISVTTVYHLTNIMWPPTGTGTDDEPMKSLEAMAREMESVFPEVLAINIHTGFSFADIRETGVSLYASTTGDPVLLQGLLSQLADYAERHR